MRDSMRFRLIQYGWTEKYLDEFLLDKLIEDYHLNIPPIDYLNLLKSIPKGIIH